MPKKSKDERFHQKAYYHVRKHKKKYLRFILFFLVLLSFRVVEDYFFIKSFGIEIEIDIFIFLTFIFVAIIFTVISELTEILIEREEAEKLLNFITKKEKMIKERIKRKS